MAVSPADARHEWLHYERVKLATKAKASSKQLWSRRYAAHSELRTATRLSEIVQLKIDRNWRHRSEPIFHCLLTFKKCNKEFSFPTRLPRAGTRTVEGACQAHFIEKGHIAVLFDVATRESSLRGT